MFIVRAAQGGAARQREEQRSASEKFLGIAASSKQYPTVPHPTFSIKQWLKKI